MIFMSATLKILNLNSNLQSTFRHGLLGSIWKWCMDISGPCSEGPLLLSCLQVCVCVCVRAHAHTHTQVYRGQPCYHPFVWDRITPYWNFAWWARLANQETPGILLAPPPILPRMELKMHVTMITMLPWLPFYWVLDIQTQALMFVSQGSVLTELSP